MIAFNTSCLEHTEIVAGPRDKLDIFCFSKINDFPHTDTANNASPDCDWEETARMPCSPVYILFLYFYSALNSTYSPAADESRERR